jgi:methyl coenzyme M reductase gamma subunit
MKYGIRQLVQIVDMNDEVIREVLFDHGQLDDALSFSLGCTVITHSLGLKEFDVVYDTRKSFESVRSKIIDIEYSLVDTPIMIWAYLEPVQLIVGQHDIGIV